MSVDYPEFRNLVTMKHFLRAGRMLCVQEFYKNTHSAIVARRKFSSLHGLRDVLLNDTPNMQLVREWVQTFEETG
jgi:hypothetical protein